MAVEKVDGRFTSETGPLKKKKKVFWEIILLLFFILKTSTWIYA